MTDLAGNPEDLFFASMLIYHGSNNFSTSHSEIRLGPNKTYNINSYSSGKVSRKCFLSFDIPVVRKLLNGTVKYKRYKQTNTFFNFFIL